MTPHVRLLNAAKTMLDVWNTSSFAAISGRDGASRELRAAIQDCEGAGMPMMTAATDEARKLPETLRDLADHVRSTPMAWPIQGLYGALHSAADQLEAARARVSHLEDALIREKGGAERALNDVYGLDDNWKRHFQRMADRIDTALATDSGKGGI